MDLYKQYQSDYLDLVSEIKDKIQNAVELAGGIYWTKITILFSEN